jgi:hypothetical protein
MNHRVAGLALDGMQPPAPKLMALEIEQVREPQPGLVAAQHPAVKEQGSAASRLQLAGEMTSVMEKASQLLSRPCNWW